MKKLFILDIDDTIVYSTRKKPPHGCDPEIYNEYLKSKNNIYYDVVKYIKIRNPDEIIFITGRSREIIEKETIESLEEAGFKNPNIIYMPLPTFRRHTKEKYIRFKCKEIRKQFKKGYDVTIIDDNEDVLDAFQTYECTLIWIDNGLIRVL